MYQIKKSQCFSTNISTNSTKTCLKTCCTPDNYCKRPKRETSSLCNIQGCKHIMSEKDDPPQRIEILIQYFKAFIIILTLQSCCKIHIKDSLFIHGDDMKQWAKHPGGKRRLLRWQLHECAIISSRWQQKITHWLSCHFHSSCFWIYYKMTITTNFSTVLK